ncbi:TolC family protein [Salinicola halophyticus]|uniref:TolC family protein n=1 Tax=Salinicola halophyticus TaxID=1808881 RepID=UPI00165FD73D|nr:TolC family protein [Salinicola halophyticus]
MLAIVVCLAPAIAHGQERHWWNAVDHGAGPKVRTDLPAIRWTASPAADSNRRFSETGVQPSAADRVTTAGRSTVRNAPLPLEKAIRRGLAINPAVRAAIADANAAGTEVDIAEWGYFPTVDLSAGPEEFPFSEFGYDASARQMLYDWGRVDSQVASADAAEREALRAVGVAEEEAALDIVEVYLDVLAAKQRLEVTENYVDDLETLRDLTVDRGSNGYTDSSEQGRVALDLAQSRDELATERGALNDARQQFRVLVGVSPGELEAPMPNELTARLEKTAALDDWIVAAPAYRQALASAAQAQAELDETQAALKPQLNLEGSLERRQIGGELQNDSVIGLRLRMDTLQGLANFQRPDAARQRLEAARYRIDDQQREIRRSVLTLIENAEVYRQRQQALTDQVKQARSVGDLYDDQFSVGLRDVNDLLTIRQEAFSARRQLIDLESQQKRIQYRAASQLGLINPLITGRLGDDAP